jgi:hypothetical protein
MNIQRNMRKFTEFGIGVTAVATLALAGCGGGGSSSPAAVVASLSGTVSTFAGTFRSLGFTDGASAVAQFYYPTFIAADNANLYVTEMGNSAIRKIIIATGEVSTFAGNLTGASGVTDGTGTGAFFNKPEGIVSDGTNLYVVDTLNNNIRQVSLATAQVTTIAGSITGASGVTNGTGTSALFNFPYGITKVGTNLYVSENAGQRIRKIELANLNLVTTFAGNVGGYGYSTGGAGTFATFNYPAGLTNDGANLYTADSNNNNIRQINISTKMVSTIAGSSWINSTVPSLGINGPGSIDGTGTNARFNHPLGITSDGSNLYVTDTLNHTIRKIIIATGVVTTLAGTVGVSGVTNATATAASFTSPRGILYNNGSLYVADTYNHSIRKVQ